MNDHESTGTPVTQPPPASPADDACILDEAADIIAEFCDEKERRADLVHCDLPDLRNSIAGTRRLSAYLRYLAGELRHGAGSAGLRPASAEGTPA